MIEVAARISGQHHLLAERGDEAAVPLRAGEGALRVLALGADDAEAVRLQLDLPAGDRVGDPPARVDGREDEGLHALDVGQPQALEGPAGDRDIGGVGDALGIDETPQPVVARNVVAPHEGAVGRVPAEARDRPLRAEDDPAAALYIGADALIAGRVGRSQRIEGDLGAVGEIAVHREGAVRGQLTIFGLEHRQHAGEDVRRDRRVPVLGEAEIIRNAELQPVAPAIADLGDQHAGAAALAAVRMGQAGQAEDRLAEQVQGRAPVGDAVADRIVDDTDRVDLPGRVLRAAGRRDDRAGRISGAIERGDAVAPLGMDRRQPAAVGEHDQHILDDAVLQRVLELDRIAISNIAARADDADAALGAHLPAAPVPGHAVGGQAIALAGHPDLARRGHHVGLVVIDELVGAELDLDRF